MKSQTGYPGGLWMGLLEEGLRKNGLTGKSRRVHRAMEVLDQDLERCFGCILGAWRISIIRLWKTDPLGYQLDGELGNLTLDRYIDGSQALVLRACN